MSRQQYMRSYSVWIQGEEDRATTTTALTAGKARYNVYLDWKDPIPDLRIIDLRTRFMGIVFPISLAKPEELKKLQVMRHTLGFSDPYGEGKSYRNYFASGSGSTDWDVLQQLVAEGLMASRPVEVFAKGMVYFQVTDAGRDWVRERKGMDTRIEFPC
jgi:hypothetical protein